MTDKKLAKMFGRRDARLIETFLDDVDVVGVKAAAARALAERAKIAGGAPTQTYPELIAKCRAEGRSAIAAPAPVERTHLRSTETTREAAYREGCELARAGAVSPEAYRLAVDARGWHIPADRSAFYRGYEQTLRLRRAGGGPL